MDYFLKVILVEAVWNCALQTQQATDEILNSDYMKAAIRIDAVVGDLQRTAEELRTAARRRESVRRSAISAL